MEDQAERENRDKRRTLKKGTCVQVAACMGFEEEHPETHIAIGIIDEGWRGNLYREWGKSGKPLKGKKKMDGIGYF